MSNLQESFDYTWAWVLELEKRIEKMENAQKKSERDPYEPVERDKDEY